MTDEQMILSWITDYIRQSRVAQFESLRDLDPAIAKVVPVYNSYGPIWPKPNSLAIDEALRKIYPGAAQLDPAIEKVVPEMPDHVCRRLYPNFHALCRAGEEIGPDRWELGRTKPVK